MVFRANGIQPGEGPTFPSIGSSGGVSPVSASPLEKTLSAKSNPLPKVGESFQTGAKAPLNAAMFSQQASGTADRVGQSMQGFLNSPEGKIFAAIHAGDGVDTVGIV